jgi:ABC-type dipeptide/oligopeptide/nickel transport system ATPase component
VSEPLLKINNLNVVYGASAQSHVVKDVSFALDAGETIAIIGESGTGKTTLALAVAGLLDRNAHVDGQVIFDREDLLALPEEAMCKVRGGGIGMIFQDPRGSLDPSMKVVDQVAEPLRLHQGMKKKEARRQARHLLEAVSISDEVIAVAPHAYQLSGGLCQRVMMAAALACNPKLLIADEPTSSLDLTLQAQIIELLRERQKASGLGVIFITHDLALVAKIADRIMVMHNGAIVEQGSVEAVIDNPANPYTAGLVSAWTGGREGEGIATA